MTVLNVGGQDIIKLLGKFGYVEDHFRDVTKMIELAKGAQREIEDIAHKVQACKLVRLSSGQGSFVLENQQ